MFESKLNKGKIGGYAGLDNQGKLPIENSQPTISGGTYSDGLLILNKTDGFNIDISGFNTASTKWYAENATPPAILPIASGASSIAFGNEAEACQPNMFVAGSSAGYQATNAGQSNFFGVNAGYQATNANSSNFFGVNAGYQAANASGSNFFGQYAGYQATNANYSNFFGESAGYQATNARDSNFMGSYAGNGATGASNSNLFGYNVGNGQVLGSLGSNNIIIGTNISLPSGTTNSLNLGGVLFGKNTYSDTTGNPSIVAQTTGRIGINVINPSEALHVSGNTLINGDLTTNTISATTYYNLPLDIRVTGFSFNNSTYDLTLTRNDDVSITSNLSILATNITVTGGTYDINTGVVSFSDNNGGTFNVSGFTSGMTDTYTTGGNVSSGTATFTKTNGESYSVSGFATTFTGGTVSGETSFTDGLTTNTISATTYLNLPTTYYMTQTYSEMVGLTDITNLTMVKVLNDENKGITNAIYHIYPDGVRMWIAATKDN